MQGFWADFFMWCVRYLGFLHPRVLPSPRTVKSSTSNHKGKHRLWWRHPLFLTSWTKKYSTSTNSPLIRAIRSYQEARGLAKIFRIGQPLSSDNSCDWRAHILVDISLFQNFQLNIEIFRNPWDALISFFILKQILSIPKLHVTDYKLLKFPIIPYSLRLWGYSLVK